MSLLASLETSTPISCNCSSFFINSSTTPSFLSRLIPNVNNLCNCSSVGFWPLTFPLYALDILFFVCPIFSSGSKFNFLISISLIPDFWAKDLIVSFHWILKTSTPISCNCSKVSIKSSILFLSFFSKNIPNSVNLSNCCLVGLFPFACPLKSFATILFLFPIFIFGFSPMFFTACKLIADLCAKVSIVSLYWSFETSTPMVCNCSNISINSCVAFLSFFSKLIPNCNNLSICSFVGGLPFAVPLYLWDTWLNFPPILILGSIFDFLISSSFTPDFSANVFIVSFTLILEISIPSLCNVSKISISSWFGSLISKLIPNSNSFFTCSSVGLV